MLLARQLSANVTDASRNISIMPRIDNRLDKKFSFDRSAAKTFIMNNSWDIFKNFYRCRWVSHKQPLQEWSNMYQFTRRLQVWLSKGMGREKLRPRWVCFSPFSYPSGLIKGIFLVLSVMSICTHVHNCSTYMEFSTVSRFLPSISWGVPSILLLPKCVPDWREALWQFIFESKNSARWLQLRLSPHHTFYLGVEPRYIICSWNGESLIPQKC